MTRDLISREAAIKTLAAHYAKKLMEFGYESYEEADTLEKMYCDGVADAMNIVDTLPSADRPRGEWVSKEELIDAINDAQFVYDGNEGGHKEYDITELVRVIFKDIIDSLSSADMRGEDE